MAGPTNEEGVEELFQFYDPKLISHQSKQQVILCTYDSNPATGNPSQCILKFFSPKRRAAWKNEEAAYSVVRDADLEIVPLPRLLWSGIWTETYYNQLIRVKLPSVLGRNETSVHVIMLSYIDETQTITRQPTIAQQKLAVKAAMLALRCLHTLKIIQGNVSEENVLLVKKDATYLAYWIDLSSCTIGASERALSREWREAIEYFSQLVLTIAPERC